MIYRYLPEQYALDLVNKGELLFRPLSHYITLEKNSCDFIRGDKNEGLCAVEIKKTHHFSIQINSLHEIPIDMKQLNRCVINFDDIFVSCFSLGENLYNEFKNPCKVTIKDFDTFLKKVEANLKLISSCKLLHQEVIYKNELTTDEAEHAEVLFIKKLRYQIQKEYRFAFIIESGQIEGIDGVHHKAGIAENSPSPLIFLKTTALKFRLGNLEDIAKIEYEY